jgi:hypothetical protein
MLERRVAPDAFDQRMDRNRVIGVEQQHCEERTLTRGADRER